MLINNNTITYRWLCKTAGKGMIKMPVSITRDGDIMRAYLEGDIDHHTARVMREAIDTSAEKCHPQKMVLDFSRVAFMDSSGIGLILGRHKLMTELGGTVAVENPTAAVERMVRLAGVGKLGVMENGGSNIK